MNSKHIFLFVSLCLFLVSGAQAHHAIYAHFDTEKPVDLNGVVTEMMIVNPHAYLMFDVIDASGQVSNWKCEMWSGTGLRRRGWDEGTIQVGDTVQVKGFMARRDVNHCLLDSATMADGSVLTSKSIVGAPTIVAADQETDPLVNPPEEIAGQPNLSGYWVIAARPGIPTVNGAPLFGGPPGDPPPTLAPTEKGLSAIQGFDFNFDAPAVKCHAKNIIFAMVHDSHTNRFAQTADALNMTYGYMDFQRTIYLGQNPQSFTGNSTAGHSIGTWQDNTLVVETSGFEPGYILASPRGATAHGENMRVIERFTLSDDRQTLVREYEATDPEYFGETYSGRDTFSRTTEGFLPYNCTELSGRNNQRPE